MVTWTTTSTFCHANVTKLFELIYAHEPIRMAFLSSKFRHPLSKVYLHPDYSCRRRVPSKTCPECTGNVRDSKIVRLVKSSETTIAVGSALTSVVQQLLETSEAHSE